MATGTDLIKEKWDDIRQAIRARWGHKISDEDLAEIVPDHAALCDLIGHRCEMTQHQARNEVSRILDQYQARGPYY